MSATAGNASSDREGAISALTAQLAATPRSVRPHQHAAIAYRLGLAHAESLSGNPADGLRKALAYYEVAAGIFDPRLDPVEHARVLNAAGAAHRGLGDRVRAAKLFEQAGGLLADRGRDDERAAALNNLGLARAELGETSAAVEASDMAAHLFDASSPEGRRGKVAALHTRGQAHAAMGGEEGLAAALADYEEARALVDDETPYHFALVEHSVGVACSALAVLLPEQTERLLSDAVTAFTAALSVFTRVAFPYQYALTKHNLGLALAGLGRPAGEDGVADLRWALACFEDTLSVLDRRIHVAEWRLAASNLEKTEADLALVAPGMSRADHFAALLAGCSDDERIRLTRERLGRILVLPDAQRGVPLLEGALASARLGFDSARAVIIAELTVVMELPRDALEPVLRARFDAHRQLRGDAREEAERALDEGMRHVLFGPQLMVVQDCLYEMGWERP